MVLTRWAYLTLGILLTALALVGAVLPLLPTAPFLLLAMFCFDRSSPALHRWILNAPIFGKYLVQWNETRTIPHTAKYKAYTLIVLSFAASIYMVKVVGLRIMLVCIAALVIWIIWRLPEGNPPETDA